MKKKKKVGEGFCPVCGAKLAYCSVLRLGDECFSYQVDCTKCSWSGEVYNLVYAFHTGEWGT